MILPEKRYMDWGVLIFITLIGYGIALYGYHQIINIPAPTSLNIPHRTIFISSPERGEEIESPLEITGKASAQEGNIIIQITDGNNNTLKKTSFRPAKDGLDNFLVGLEYEAPTTRAGRIEAFEYTNDGIKTNIRIIPVLFSDYEE